MPILGMRTTANFVTNQRPENYREAIALLYPKSPEIRKAPLTALTSVMKKRKVIDPVFHWWEKELNNRRFQLTADLPATAGGAAGTLTIDATYNTATGLKKNDMLYVEQTGETMMVSADPTATNQIPVTRGFSAGGTGVALTLITAGTNPYLMVIGSGFEEGSVAPTGVNFDPLERNNYTQIFRSTWEMTRTAKQTQLRTGDARKEAKRECLEYYAVDQERAYFFGKKNSATVSGKPLRTMSGVFEQITSASAANVITADATNGVNMDTLMAWMELMFRFGSSEKMAFGGSGALLTINEIVRKNTSMQIESGIKEYGMEVSKLRTPFGTLVFMPHPLFSQSTGGTVGGTQFYGLDTTMVVLDMNYVSWVYLQDIVEDRNITPVSLDGEKGGMIGECSLELQFPKTHFIFKQMKKAVKDA